MKLFLCLMPLAVFKSHLPKMQNGRQTPEKTVFLFLAHPYRCHCTQNSLERHSFAGHIRRI